MKIQDAQKIHCIGIGGIGVSALAALWRAQGKEVSGSDAETGGHRAENVKDVDLVVYSDAVPEDNVERVEARRRGIPEMSYAQALGQVSREYKTIVVTGTHGKSTTTAMLGLILEAAGLDPLVLVGSKVPGWPLGNLRLPNPTSYLPTGKAGVLGPRFFVVEGDDYRDHFLELSPYAVVVTAIEHDHPDYFRDLEHTLESFKTLAEKVSENGFIVLNEDDKGCRMLHSTIRPKRRMAIYGKGSEVFSKLQLQVPGQFNRYNATAAATAAMQLGVSDEIAQKALGEFKGIWRRFEVVGSRIFHNSPQPSLNLREGDRSVPPLKVRGGRGSYAPREDVLIISDYAHHPTAIRETMKAAREAYPDRRLVLVYQPHQHSRTKHLFQDFVEALRGAADILILSEIYAVKGRMEDQDINSQNLVDAISNFPAQGGSASGGQFPISKILYGGDLEQTKRIVLEQIQPGDVVIFMGAGDIDTIARQVVDRAV